MIRTYGLLILLLLIFSFTNAQEILVFNGTVKCYIENDQRATKGAQNIVVVPGFIPAKAGMTGPQGYYELNTSAPLNKLEGKYVMIYYVSSCRQCELKKNVFVSADQAKLIKNNLSYLTVETIQMNAGCKNTELQPIASDSVYNAFIKLPAQDLDKVSALNVVTATPGFLNVLTNLVTAPIVINAGTFSVDTTNFLPGQINGYGKFLFASPMFLTPNMGFNFAPFRDGSEAVFWNPSTLAKSNHKAEVNLFTNIKNNIKFSAYTKITDKLALGIGGIYTMQDNFRKTIFENLFDTIQHFQELKEYAAFLSPSFKITKDLSVGASLKSVWQRFNIPDQVFITQSPDANVFTDSTVSTQKFDADISISYNITRSLLAGINVMNLAGSKLYADAFPAGKKVNEQKNLRAAGIGLCYKWKQFNFGADALVTEDDMFDLSVGVNYIPFNNALVSGGFAFKQKAFALAFKMKYFRISYVNDNDFMVNEKREGKINLLNGQLYSGLSFTF